MVWAISPQMGLHVYGLIIRGWLAVKRCTLIQCWSMKSVLVTNVCCCFFLNVLQWDHSHNSAGQRLTPAGEFVKLHRHFLNKKSRMDWSKKGQAHQNIFNHLNKSCHVCVRTIISWLWNSLFLKNPGSLNEVKEHSLSATFSHVFIYKSCQVWKC